MFVLTVTNLSESVEEGFGQPFPATALSEGVLAAKDLGLLVLNLEAHAQFGYVDLCSVIKAGVQTLEHRLGGQVQLAERGECQFDTTGDSGANRITHGIRKKKMLPG